MSRHYKMPKALSIASIITIIFAIIAIVIATIGLTGCGNEGISNPLKDSELATISSLKQGNAPGAPSNPALLTCNEMAPSTMQYIMSEAIRIKYRERRNFDALDYYCIETLYAYERPRPRSGRERVRNYLMLSTSSTDQNQQSWLSHLTHRGNNVPIKVFLFENQQLTGGQWYDDVRCRITRFYEEDRYEDTPGIWHLHLQYISGTEGQTPVNPDQPTTDNNNNDDEPYLIEGITVAPSGGKQ